MATTPDYPILGPPRISTLGFAEILRSNRSPAASEALSCYQAALGQGVDPAVMLAVFRKESTFGRFGYANRNRSWGNIRESSGAFRAYSSWTAGAADCARLLAVYGRNQIRPGRNTSTVQTFPYVWAPAADGNAPDRYGDQLASWITEWQRRYPASGSGAGLAPAPTPGGSTSPSSNGLVGPDGTAGNPSIAAWLNVPASAPFDGALLARMVEWVIANRPGQTARAEAIRVEAAWRPFTTRGLTAGQVASPYGGDGRPWNYSTDPITAVADAIGALPGAIPGLVVNGALLVVVLGLGWSGLRDLLGGGDG